MNTSTRLNLKFFTHVLKKDTPESFTSLFFTEKVCTVIYSEEGYLHEVSSGHVASALCSPSCLSCVMAAEN